MEFEEALLSLITMTTSNSPSGLVGADQLRELNANLKEAFKAQKVVEGSQYVRMSEKSSNPVPQQ